MVGQLFTVDKKWNNLYIEWTLVKYTKIGGYICTTYPLHEVVENICGWHSIVRVKDRYTSHFDQFVQCLAQVSAALCTLEVWDCHQHLEGKGEIGYYGLEFMSWTDYEIGIFFLYGLNFTFECNALSFLALCMVPEFLKSVGFLVFHHGNMSIWPCNMQYGHGVMVIVKKESWITRLISHAF